MWFDQTTFTKFYWVCLQDYIALLKAWYNETFMTMRLDKICTYSHHTYIPSLYGKQNRKTQWDFLKVNTMNKNCQWHYGKTKSNEKKMKLMKIKIFKIISINNKENNEASKMRWLLKEQTKSQHLALARLRTLLAELSSSPSDIPLQGKSQQSGCIFTTLPTTKMQFRYKT